MDFKKQWKVIEGHMMGAISYILPLIIGASLVIACAKILGMVGGVTDLGPYADQTGFFNILYSIEQIGWTGIGLMNAVFAGFLAYSIADKPGLAAGFIGGMIANNMMMGFVGALIAGFFAGWITNVVKNKIKLKGAASGLVPLVILPLITVGLTGILMAVVLSGPLGSFNTGLVNWVGEMCQSNTNFAIVAMILGGMIGFDLGGPVGKAAWMSVNALLLSGVYMPAIALNIAICIPPLGYGLATIIKAKRFNSTYREAGKGALVMGIIGITEGAIPFTLKYPAKLIPINVIASALGAGVVVLLGAFDKMPPIGGIYGCITVGNPLAYLAGGLVGASIIALAAIYLVDFSKEEEEDIQEDADFGDLVLEEL